MNIQNLHASNNTIGYKFRIHFVFWQPLIYPLNVEKFDQGLLDQ